MTSRYYVRANGKIFGPFEKAKLLALVKQGKVGPIHEISTDGKQWRVVRNEPWLIGDSTTQSGRNMASSQASDTPGVEPLPLSGGQWLANNAQPTPLQPQPLTSVSGPFVGPVSNSHLNYYTPVRSTGPSPENASMRRESESTDDARRKQKKQKASLAVKIIAAVLILILPCVVAMGGVGIWIWTSFDGQEIQGWANPRQPNSNSNLTRDGQVREVPPIGATSTLALPPAPKPTQDSSTPSENTERPDQFRFLARDLNGEYAIGDPALAEAKSKPLVLERIAKSSQSGWSPLELEIKFAKELLRSGYVLAEFEVSEMPPNGDSKVLKCNLKKLIRTIPSRSDLGSSYSSVSSLLERSLVIVTLNKNEIKSLESVRNALKSKLIQGGIQALQVPK